MKQLLTYITCLLWIWAPLLQSAPLSVFLGGGVITESSPPPVVSTNISFTSSTAGSFSGTTSPNIAYPETLENDILIVVLAGDTVTSSSGTPPTGWTKLDQVEHGTTGTIHIFWKRAAITPVTSEVWTNLLSAGTTGIFTALGYRGCITNASPIDVSLTGSQSGSISWSTGSITTTGTDRMAIGIFGGDLASGISFTWGAGITERIDYNNNGFGALTIGDILVPAAGSVTMTTAPTISTTGARAIYALKPIPAS